MRVCRTPALGGKIYICKGCKEEKYVYFSCGNSRCVKCQGIKRMIWQEKLSRRLLKCAYQHMVFTLPSELRPLARRHPSEIYSLLMRSSWKSLKKCSAKSDNLGALPGAIMVLHTFGSDLKYHVHVHALVTYGGIGEDDRWKWPKRKQKLVPFREIRREFKEILLNGLKEIYPKLTTTLRFEDIEKDLINKEWCVHQEPPTSNTKTITEYLGKYINRIGLSIQRFNYDKVHDRVTLTHKDYRNHKDKTKPAPMTAKHMDPLVAIHQILQHCLPKYFQKCRYYGLHASASFKKHREKIPKMIKNEGQTIRSVMQLIRIMLGLKVLGCSKCGKEEFEEAIIPKQRNWIHQWVSVHNKDPVGRSTYRPTKQCPPPKAIPMSKRKKKRHFQHEFSK